MRKNEFLKYLEFQKKYSKNTISSYAIDIKQYQEFCTDNNYTSDTKQIVTDPKIIRNWIVELTEKGNSTISINRKISAISSYYKFLLKENLIKTNPAEKIIRPKIKKKLPLFLNNQQTQNLKDFEIFSDDFNGIRDKLIIEMLYQTGIRRDELITLKKKDIDFEKKTVKVTGKRNKQRIIPYPDQLQLLIKQYSESEEISANKTEFMFFTPKGEKLYPNFVYRTVNKYIRLISTQKKISPHILRHTYATHMLNNGADINSVKELLGHANLAATQIYTHNTFDKINKAYKLAHPRALK